MKVSSAILHLSHLVKWDSNLENFNTMRRFFIITAMCLIGTLLLPVTAGAQVISGGKKDKPKWATPAFKRTLEKTYLEVVVVTGQNREKIISDAEKEIVRRRKLMVGEDDIWMKSGHIGEYWEETNDGLTGYFLYQTRKNPTYEPETIDATTHYGFSGRVFVPGAQQIWKGQPGKAALFIGGEVVCIGGIIASQSLKANYISKLNGTHNSSQKQVYASNANAWNMAGYGFIAGAVAFYVWNIIDGIVAPGRPTIKYDNKVLAFGPAVTPEYAGFAASLTF